MLNLDPKRNGEKRYRCGTDLYLPGTGTIDAGYLDAESFLRWLRLRGGYNPWAEELAMRLLGYPEMPDIGTSTHETAMAGLAIAASGPYDFWVDVQINDVARSQHQAELLLLGYDRHENSFTFKLS